jgi:mannose-6-phosphate isomerase class I
MRRESNYDKFPINPVSASGTDCCEQWPAILDRLRAYSSLAHLVICVECYPGVLEVELRKIFEQGLQPAAVMMTTDLLKDSFAIERMVGAVLGDDPVFGRMNGIQIEDFFDERRLGNARALAANWKQGLLLIIGTGATLLAPEPDILIYADLARWEIQKRQRRNQIANFGAENFQESAGLKYKRAFFVDWRAADRLKAALISRINFWLDTNSDIPKLVTGQSMREGLNQLVHRPFRVVPYFDPGPWGGHWMEEVCDLPHDVPNHAWCFDCVPEENSLLLKFGSSCVEVPAMNLILLYPCELLGQGVYARFGAEFPIRFDFLDTMGGGNLSLQVHPKSRYIGKEFGMKYTQDESYYLLDVGENGSVYLGVKSDINREAMIRELKAAQENSHSFRAEAYINKFPAKKHDHFLIPAGTIHCSGKNSMVLEISATPYIFTFKLWDWGRLGLDGLPRPIHLEHGLKNISWDRDTDWVRENLINQIEQVAEGPGWREERTGLHQLEFIETRRHWFTAPVTHSTQDTVNVLNLVEGEEAIVESPTDAFEPFVLHYAETFIAPAALGDYRISPAGQSIEKNCGTIKASVRKEWAHSEPLPERPSTT